MATPNLSVNLPINQLAANGQALAGLGGDPQAALAQLGPLYAQGYQASLGLNDQLLRGTQGGYESLRQAVNDQYAGIKAGYDQLGTAVQNQLIGTNTTNLNDIQDRYRAASGAAAQAGIDRGIGNTTIALNMQRAIEQDAARARTDSQEKFAQLRAGYQSQIGQAGLGSQREGVGLGANLGQNQLAMLERTNIPYPDAGMFSKLAEMYGASAQAQQDRRDLEAAMPRGGGGTFSRSGVGGVVSGAGGSSMPFGPRMNYGTNMYGSPTPSGPAPMTFASGPAAQALNQGSISHLLNAYDTAYGSSSGYGGEGYAPAPLAMGAVGGGAMAGLGYAGFGGPMFEGGYQGDFSNGYYDYGSGEWIGE